MTLPRARRPLLRATAFGGMAAVLVAAACRAPGPARPAPTDAPRSAPADTPAEAAAGEADAVMIPALAATVHGETVLAPATTIAGTGQTVIVSATATTQAVEAVIVPGTATTRPAQATVVSTTASTRPGEAVIVPATATMRPAQATVVSTTASTRPGGAVIVPATATMRPAEAVTVTTTTTASTRRGEAVIVPARATTRPGEAVIVTGTATTRPASATIVPGTATTRPVDAVIAPATTTRPADAVVAPATTTPRRDTVPASVANPEELTRALQREYPAQFRDAGIFGTAVLELRLAADGTVARTRIVESSHPAFGEAAVRAVAAARFHPARHRGVAVASTARIPVMFRLSREAAPVSSRAGRAPADVRVGGTEPAYDQPPEPASVHDLARALNAAYPPLLRGVGVAADAHVVVRVAASGEVLSAQAVAASHPEAGAAAARVLSGTRFRPARKDGRPVAAEVEVPVHFRLDTMERP